MKNQPIIIEMAFSEGSNNMGFHLRGSHEWFNENKEFILDNVAHLAEQIKQTTDEQQKADMLAACEALQHGKSYQGQFGTVTIIQTN